MAPNDGWPPSTRVRLRSCPPRLKVDGKLPVVVPPMPARLSHLERLEYRHVSSRSESHPVYTIVAKCINSRRVWHFDLRIFIFCWQVGFPARSVLPHTSGHPPT